MLTALDNIAALCELLDMLDQKRHEIGLLIRQSNDPDSDGLCDRCEYFIGVGFVACQQYLVESLLFTGIDKKDAYGLGPVHCSGTTYVNLINDAANWWKHESEWWVYKNKVPNNSQRTFDSVTDIAKARGYELSQVLASICGSKNFSFKSVVPFLVDWRKAVLSTL